MSMYVVESYDFSVEHGGRDSKGVIGEHKGKEKLYLHVLPFTDAEIKKLKPRVDENGNTEHARLALPGNEVWWISLEGEAAWPNLYRPRITSRCEHVDGKPRAVPVSPEDLERLRKAGVPGL
jgi:hypothetical protein